MAGIVNEKIIKLSDKLEELNMTWTDLSDMMEVINLETFFDILKKAKKWDKHEKSLENAEKVSQLREVVWSTVSGRNQQYDFIERLKLAEQILNDAIKDGIVFDFSIIALSIPKLLDDYIHGYDLPPTEYYSLEQSKLCEYITLDMNTLDDYSSEKYVHEMNDILGRIQWKNEMPVT